MAALAILITPISARATCRQALALGLDVSGSVDDREYRMQLRGLAGALRDPSVRAALLAFADRPVSILVFEWSGASYQTTIVDWTAITDSDALQEITNQLATHPRHKAPFLTSIGGAMRFAAAQFLRVPDCIRKTLDLSGDGLSNSWPAPERLRQTPPFADITINALVILPDVAAPAPGSTARPSDLLTYFEQQVIHGPRAFAEPAAGFADYQSAMTRKLLRELEGPQLTAVSPSP